MALQPSIILQGQAPQPVNALAQGMEAGQRFNDIRRTNDMRAMLRDQGGAILAGDQNALNALAAFDPAAAQGIQTGRLNQDATRLGMDATRQQMDQRSQQMRIALEEYAAGKTAAQVQAELAEEERQLRMLLGTQSPEQWDAMAVQIGADELVGQHPNRQALAMQFMDMSDVVADMFATPEAPRPQTQIAKLQADLQAGLITQDQYDLALQNMAPTGMQITSDGQGGFTLVQGAGVGGTGSPDLTVEESKNAGFLERLRASGPILDELEQEGLSFAQQALGAVPGGVGNYARTPEFQRYDQARRDFVNAILRRESGAVISAEEFENANQQYFPVPGDSPQVIAQKRANRAAAIRGLEIGAGAGAGLVTPPAADGPDFATMSIEEIEAWLAANGG